MNKYEIDELDDKTKKKVFKKYKTIAFSDDSFGGVLEISKLKYMIDIDVSEYNLKTQKFELSFPSGVDFTATLINRYGLFYDEVDDTSELAINMIKTSNNLIDECNETNTDTFKRLLKEYLKLFLREDYKYATSYECLEDYFINNDWVFDEEGNKIDD
jgi:hypothetical protein